MEPDWCSVSADRALAKCMRVEAGSFKAKEDRAGARYFLHRLVDGPRQHSVALRTAAGAEAPRADADTLNAVYAAFLSHLTLTKTHRENLLQRGLSDEVIDRNGYKTLPIQGRARIARALQEQFGDQLLRVPGFVIKDRNGDRYLTVRGPAGLVIPVRDLAGRIVALKIRRDDPVSGSRFVYCSSAGHGGPGPGSRAHVPLGIATPAEVVRLTEGELKSDVAMSLSGLPTVAIPGAANWKPCLPLLKKLGAKTVRLALDMDAWDKPSVARPLSACADALAGEGYAVELERWDPADAKGIDDLLVSGKAPELLQSESALAAIRDILAAATSGEESAPPDELARLSEVLQSGGAEALFRDKALMQALADLSSADPAGFAAVRASIRECVSVRDLDKALRPFRRLTAPDEGGDTPPYFEANGCIYRNVQTKEGPIHVALCNFAARIVEDLVHDDGAEQARYLAMQGALADGAALPRAEVLAVDFPRMEWIVPSWGTRAVVYAGMGTRDHLRTALQLLSGDVPRRTVFRHLGWRKIGNTWAYLHASGAFRADGVVPEVTISLPDALVGFGLPQVPTGGELLAAVRASLGILDGLAPDRIVFPLLAAVFRAPLGGCDFAVHLAGPTGVFKSELAALCQQHYGPGLDARHLPGSWASTGNSLEGIAFAAKDALLVVDDFAPAGSTADVQRYHREADRLLRAQGNHAGRQRMRYDGSLRPAKPPRGLILSTGEDVPRGQSLRARLFTLEIGFGDVDRELLTASQRDAAAGVYAQALAAYLQWLAPRYEDIHRRLRDEVAGLRGKATSHEQHARTPGIVADLAIGLRYLLDFAQHVAALTRAEVEALKRRGWKAIVEAAERQAEHVRAAEPAGQFLRLLSAALASGRAHVANAHGNEPNGAQKWGWRPKAVGTGDQGREEWQAQGRRIGWVEGENLYLEPDFRVCRGPAACSGAGRKPACWSSDPVPAAERARPAPVRGSQPGAADSPADPGRTAAGSFTSWSGHPFPTTDRPNRPIWGRWLDNPREYGRFVGPVRWPVGRQQRETVQWNRP
jgi:hypothetical protein